MSTEAETVFTEIIEAVIPTVASKVMAAALLGFSRPALDRLIKDGLIAPAEVGTGVSLAEVERIRGRPVALADWLRARARIDAQYESRKAGGHACP